MPTNTVQDRAILAGISRLRAGLQRVLTWFQGSTALGTPGQFTNIQLGTNLTGTPSGDTLVIDATGGGGGGSVNSVTGDGSTAEVDNTDPANPIVSANGAVTLANAYTDSVLIVGPVVGTFENAGLVLSGTVTGLAVWVPYDFTITGWNMGGDGTVGSGTIDVQVSTDQSSWTSITAAAQPSVTLARSNSSTTLTGWTTTFVGGTWVRFVGSGFSGWTASSITLDLT